MSLGFGKSPFGSGRGVFSFGSLPDHVSYLEDWPRRMRAVFAGETVLDSRDGKVLHETGALPVHYFPLAAVREELLIPTGDGHSWSIGVGDRTADNVVTAGPEGDDPVAVALRHMVMIDHGAMDRWFEEDDPIYAHPRDPYHRVDIRASSRHVVVRHRGQVAAESHRPKPLFETGNPIRYYLPFADVCIDLLELSDTVSECPYKGDGQHWHLVGNGARNENAAWSLPHPLPEGLAATEHLCFYPNKVDIEVDGEPVGE